MEAPEIDERPTNEVSFVTPLNSNGNFTETKLTFELLKTPVFLYLLT